MVAPKSGCPPPHRIEPEDWFYSLPTGFQFFLESDLFQHPGFRLFLFLVADFVGAGTANDPGLSQN